jgi:D-glycero-alpha-D-manno-heptose-7-phosphate kinase
MDDSAKFALVRQSRDKAYIGAKFIEDGRLDDFGSLLHDAWMDKKAVETSITNEYFDEIYTRALTAGALGGKLLGAGGGGFFLFYVDPSKRANVINSITRETPCKVYDFKFALNGSRVSSYS